MHELDPIDFARHLRKTGTSSENYLWQLLRGRLRCGKKFRRQHPLGIYTTDFFCIEAKLVIELDGARRTTRRKACSTTKPATPGCVRKELRS